MKKRYIVLPVLAAIWMFAMVATLPELIAVWPERKAVEKTFNAYADDLVNQRFEEAYARQSSDFQKSVTLDSFVRYQHDLQLRFGILKSVEQEGMKVQRFRNPSGWRASIKADLQYEKAKVRCDFELRRDNGLWTIFSSKGEEE